MYGQRKYDLWLDFQGFIIPRHNVFQKFNAIHGINHEYQDLVSDGIYPSKLCQLKTLFLYIFTLLDYKIKKLYESISS